MSKPNRDAFITTAEYELGNIARVRFQLETWLNDDKSIWVLAMYGDSVREHVELDDQTAALMLRSCHVD
jgi:hypothetical protein